jgi:hypothetical protein
MAERRQAARMQLVRVDEVDLVAPESAPEHASRHGGAPSDDDRAPASSTVRRLPRRWWVVLVAAVAAVVVAWQFGAAQDRAYVRRITAVPGLVHPLDGAPHARWSAPALSASSALEAADGRLVVAAREDDRLVLRAHELTTGAQRWTQPVADAPTGDTEGPDIACPSDGADVGPLVVCLVAPARSLYATGAGRRSGTPTTVLALAADDGRRVGRWQVTDAVLDSARIGDDVVLVTYDHDGYLSVERRGAADGTTRWAVRSDDRLEFARATPATSVQVEGSWLVVHGVGTLVLDAATGRVLLDASSFQNVRAVPVEDGIATWHIGSGWLVSGLDGTVRYALPGAPAFASVDDGTTASTLVVDSGTTLRGVDPATGRVLWSQPQVMGVVAHVSHRLVAAGDNRWGVLDPRDGSEVWSVQLGEPVPWDPVSDGGLVLGPGDTADGDLRLEAYHLGDGVFAWSVALPRDVAAVRVVAGHLVARTADRVVVYG